MKIENHRLIAESGAKFGLNHTWSPNKGGSGANANFTPRFLVVHYTAGRGADQTVGWLTNPEANASAHVVVGRDGTVYQLVEFDKTAWHAGKSRWNDLVGLNPYSFGMELDNAGRLHRQGSRWMTWFGREVKDEDVVEATHKHEKSPAGWHAYTEAQLDAAESVAQLLIAHYGIREILGHEDIAPERKSDPGPAFPMDMFQAHLLGRRDVDEDAYEATTALNIRSGPGPGHAALLPNPLPKGTRVSLLRRDGAWGFVDVLSLNEPMDLSGWVHTRYLRKS